MTVRWGRRACRAFGLRRRNCDLRGAGSLGAVEAASVGDEEVDGGRGEIEILWRGRHLSDAAAAADGMLRQMDSICGMHFLKFILAEENFLRNRITRPASPCMGCDPMRSTWTLPVSVDVRSRFCFPLSKSSASSARARIGSASLRRGLRVHIAGGQNALHFILRSQKERGLLGLQQFRFHAS